MWTSINLVLFSPLCQKTLRSKHPTVLGLSLGLAVSISPQTDPCWVLA